MSIPRKPRPFKNEWQNELQRLKNEHAEKYFPEFHKANGEIRGKWNDETANGLTKAIVEYLDYIGGEFTRVNVMGTPRKNKFGKLIFTASTTKKGTADILGVFKGRYTAIEVKIGADRQSQDQIKQMDKTQGAGGVYIIARNMTDFLIDFKHIFKL